MKRRKVLSMALAAACAAILFSGCGSGKEAAGAPSEEDSKGTGNTADAGETDADNGEGGKGSAAETADAGGADGQHEPITMESPFRDISPFLDVLNEKYPEVNLEILPYSGKNTTTYLQDELKADDMPDIYVATVYSPGQMDLSDRLIDLSSYSFTSNFAEARLRDVSDNGAIYLLPTNFTCLGITYNKTLLEKNGWELPTTFEELEELAPKVKEAGYDLALDQISLPGYGFQYLCNILDTDFLNTLDGRAWQKNFLNGTATVQGTPDMEKSLETLEKWKKLGMLTGNGDWKDDSKTKAKMAEGNTLFMLGAVNSFKEGESESEFGIMPYLSEDGTQNSLILNVSRYVGLNKRLEDAGNEQKLEDAVHVMEVLSTVDGLNALNSGLEYSTLLPLQDYTIPEDNYYKQVEHELNAGLTAPFIYAGWEDLIVPIGNVMLDYIKDEATLDDVMHSFDDNQHLLKDNSSRVYTTVTEKLDTDDCAKLVGICFGKASGADLSLISKNKWYRTEGDISDLNMDGVNGSLFALPVTDQEITTILPTGWRGNIQTVTLTGKRIRELAETGYEKEGRLYPYDLITPEGMTIDDDATYKVAICGVSDEVAEEGNLTDTGILGLDAAEDYLTQFATLSRKDLRWE